MGAHAVRSAGPTPFAASGLVAYLALTSVRPEPGRDLAQEAT